MNRLMLRLVTAASMLLASATVLAHTGGHAPGRLFSGVMHPLLGVDHVLALSAIGLWAATSSLRRTWLPVVVFLCVMTAGSALATRGILLPGIETGIAVSLLVAGLLLMTFARLSPLYSTTLIALFALFHGQAHGLEMPVAAAPVLYGTGLIFSSGLLLLAGTRLGVWLRQVRAEWFLRGAGALSGAVGAWLLVGA